MEVRLEKINKHFGGVKAVSNVDLHVRERDFVTLVGPSGCGKTTLLRIIAGLERPTSGTLYFGDRVVTDIPPGSRNIAMVFQSYALYPHMNVARNLGYGLKVRGTPKDQIESRVAEVAKVLEIDALLHRKPKELSGGQRQRVALGRAMVRNPSIFLMDEPLSNLDAKLRVTMRAELKRFHMDLKTTTIYVTHDQLEAMTMSDRIAVMNKGELQQYGTPEEVYTTPASMFVAGFIGSPPMNFLRGTITQEGAAPALRIGEVSQALPERLTEALRRHKGEREVVLGIRPQDVALVPPGNGSHLSARVFVVEHMGSEKFVDLRLPGNVRVTAEVKASERIAVDEDVCLDMNLDGMHLFDPETERAIGSIS